MAISDPYASESDFRQRSKSPGGISTAGEMLEDDLVAMSRLIERQLGQFFNLDEEAVTRVFRVRRSAACLPLTGDPDNPLVPGLATMDGLIVKRDEDRDGSFADETAWASSDLEALPRNQALGPEPRPILELGITETSSKAWFAAGELIQVTAVFGWPAVPSLVKNLCIEMTRIWRIEGPRGSNRINERDQVFSVSGTARSLLEEALQAYSWPVFR